jgi:hypothetical protein
MRPRKSAIGGAAAERALPRTVFLLDFLLATPTPFTTPERRVRDRSREFDRAGPHQPICPLDHRIGMQTALSLDATTHAEHSAVALLKVAHERDQRLDALQRHG